MTNLKPWLWLLMVCLLLAAGLAGVKYLQIRKAIAFAESMPERSESVTAVTARANSKAQTYRTIGELRATRFVELRNELDGKIVRIGFEGGDTVAEGQLLLELDSSEERAQLRATRAQLKLAELQLERLQELRLKKLASKNDYDRALADKDVLHANAAALSATISKKTLNAPFAAQTGLHSLQVGQYLGPNTLITELSGNQGEYWLDFSLPQEKATLSIGDSVLLSAPNLLDSQLQARLISADASIDRQSRSRAYRALVPQAPEVLRPGAVLSVDVAYTTLDGVYELPATAVRRSSFAAFVFVLEPSEPGADAPYRARRQTVELKMVEGEHVFVTGLNEGQLIAAIGAFKLQDGLLVHVVERVTTQDSSGQ